jgi:2-(1,2-epoxy-1,2-dihydrophenyl)acetyl-CoA isomerase
VPEDHLRVQRHGQVAVITLNRPARLNALSPELITDLREVLRDADGDRGTGAVVLTGEGRAFSSGADLRAVPQDAEQFLRDYYHPLVTDLLQLGTPVVAAINGIVVGAAVSLTLACDLRIAAATAVLQMPFVRLGLVPDAGATWLLPRAIGTARAAEMALLGRPVPADQALAWGLVNEVTDPAGLRDRALAVAATLAALPPSAGMTRRLLNQSPQRTLADQLASEAAAQGAARQSPEFEEALAAFTRRQPPRSG